MSADMQQDLEDRAESIRMIRDSAAGIASRGGDRRRVRDLRFRKPGYDPAVLRQMGEQGWIGLRVPEALGGAGLGLREFCALAEELGAALAPEPLIPAALSAALLAAAGAQEPLQRLLSGEELLLTAWQEAPARLEAPGSATAPRLFIPAASGAAAFLVPVAQNGRMALRVQQGKAALALDGSQDGGFLGTLQPGDGQLIAADIGSALQDALDEAALATAAYLLGVMDQAFALTLDYLRTRQQFGRPIGGFQALQHRAADLKIQVALTRASIEAAAALLDRGDAPPAARRAAVSRAKARAAEASLLVTRQAIQFHGGIGYTDEADIGLHLRKAMVLASAFGSAAFHRRRFAAEAREDEA
ncbi:acyl-CoA dehydrogenase family protein [Pseudoroseomonas ludipueritiae]|uniref:Acyl-CoA dehydrogenase family protein n=1 Tax=Pseudoroseomonas ludipueritiae TaxID=198093 RepID=A0ABR7R486_9PROT|nr:acyl-CoA dehydrogenase family protein [Pseudoroseomonas ludipueritiae]MBC9176572.1 acyl-CoA dehydrogenase family protein [Pseudoroseomonas ludipueritiae]